MVRIKLMDGGNLEIPREEALELIPYRGVFASPMLRHPIEGLVSHRGKVIPVLGPLPPDTMFHEEARRRYDAALCMYHDQALIPIKTLAGERAVNVTLGLPFVRTSPDHGTAFDIAGQGKADPSSLVAAIELAAAMAGRAKASG